MTDYFHVRVRGQQTCRNWNEVVPIGTAVTYQGVVRHVESWAGLGKLYEPGVFLAGIEEPVPLAFIEVPGWTMKPGGHNKLGEHSK